MSRLICGFPGVGKTYFKNNSNDKVYDSDSSEYSWLNFDNKVRHHQFPQNYIKAIKHRLTESDMVLASTHKIVLNGLIDAGIDFTLVYPQRHLRNEYLGRYRLRYSDPGLISLLYRKWDSFIDDLDGCPIPTHNKIVLGPIEYLSDVLDEHKAFKIAELKGQTVDRITIDEPTAKANHLL